MQHLHHFTRLRRAGFIHDRPMKSTNGEPGSVPPTGEFRPPRNPSAVGNPACRRLAATAAACATLSVGFPGGAQDGAPTGHLVPLFPVADDPVRQGFVRVVNRSGRGGEVEIRATDDEGSSFGPTTMTLEARQTIHFNSTDLEEGNEAKGLPDGVGSGVGDWRLDLRSGLDIRVLSYIRTPADGFLTSMHDLVPQSEDDRHRVAIFNPASNVDQVSRLRLINPGDDAAEVTVEGIDDSGAAGAGEVRLTVSAGAATTLDAQRLETGGSGTDGALGDGDGKWRLTVRADQPIHAMNLLSSPNGHLTNLSTTPSNVDGDVHAVPLFPAASDALGRQGFVRVINRSDTAGEVAIRAFDDSERDFGTSTLALEAGQTGHFNSDDLEGGNSAKGLTGGTGAGDGDWRLTLESDLDLEVLAYIRTRDGFLTAMHDTVGRQGGRHRVPTFNPGSNEDQASRLRLANDGDEAASVTIAGIDDAGERSTGTVTVTVPAGSSRTLTAQELEAGGARFDGKLGDGKGKWRLIVESEQPISVMSLLSSPTGHLTNLSTDPGADTSPTDEADPFAHWNDLEPQAWWRESKPYSCRQEDKETSPWLDAGLDDLGGSDPLSLIRYFGNGSYLRYGHMGFNGCTRLTKYPDSYYLDPPADPTYYSLGDLAIHVDIARVPADAKGWDQDDGKRVEMSMTEAVELLNTHVAAYFRRVSGDRLRIAFQAGNDFDVPGDGSPDAAGNERNRLIGACLEGCDRGEPGGLNRLLLSDVATDTGGSAYNGSANFGLATLRDDNMETVVHEMGHGWMFWPHSFTELPWRGSAGEELGPPNPYTNFHDIISGLDLTTILGWDADMPSPLALSRYTAGWIDSGDVALHLNDSATYTLGKPFEDGYQFLVVHSGRRFAFTTLEVLEERTDRFKVSRAEVYDPTAPGGYRARRYDGVLVSRYDQSAGTGLEARFGPALHDADNPDFLIDVGWGRDDHSVIPDGASREIGGGVTVAVARNDDGSYEVTVSGGRVAEFTRWCSKIWFSDYEYDTGCLLDEGEWE